MKSKLSSTFSSILLLWIYNESYHVIWQMHGINMAVGVNGHMGKPLIREGQGIHIQVRRSLRDVFRKVPTISIEVQVMIFFLVFYIHDLFYDKSKLQKDLLYYVTLIPLKYIISKYIP